MFKSDDLNPVFLASGFGRLGRVGGDGGLTGFFQHYTTLHIWFFGGRGVDKGVVGFVRGVVDRDEQYKTFLPLLL